MHTYQFSGQDKGGKPASGTVDARSRESALSLLAEKEILVTTLTAKNGKGSLKNFFRIPFARIGGEDLMVFTEELAALVEASIPMKTAMDVLAQDCENPSLKQITKNIANGISGGSALSDEMRQFPEAFSKLYVSLVSIGEKSGKIPLILNRLAGYIENAEGLKNKVKSSLYYPLAVATFGFVMTVLFFLLAAPRVKALYNLLGAPLPAPTRILLDVGLFLSGHWFLFFLALTAAVWAAVRFLKTKKGSYWADQLLFKLPVFGELFKRFEVARFSRSLSTLYSSGIPLIRSLELLSEATNSPVMHEILQKVIANIHKGGSMVDPLRRTRIFSSMSVSMIAAGEQSGSLDTMLTKLANFYDAQVEAAVKGLSSLIEPLVMMFVGALLGAVIIALGLPFLNIGAAAMYQINK